MSRALVLVISLLLAGCTFPNESTQPPPTPATTTPIPTMTPTPSTPPTPAPDDNKTEPGVELVYPDGVEMEIIAGGLNFPTGLDWDDNGTLYVGLVGFAPGTAQIVRIGEGGNATNLTFNASNLSSQLLDITYHEGEMYFSTEGAVHALNLSTMDLRTVFEGLPAKGDHKTDEIVFGPDGRLYVSEGSMTNSAVLGLDQAGVPDSVTAVIAQFPLLHEKPCEDITVTGANYETANPFQGALMNETREPASNFSIDAFKGAMEDARVVWYNRTAPKASLEENRTVTSPFAPFGTPLARGATVKGDVRCNGAVLSMEKDGTDARVEGWGWRNPFAIKFHPNGTLVVSNNAYDSRGSRPVAATPDELWLVELGEGGKGGLWHGYPDFSMGRPITDPFFHPLFGSQPELAILRTPNRAPLPMTFFSDHASANKFDFGPANTSYEGDLFVAEFGTLNIELRAGAFTGMDIAHVDMKTGRVTEFIAAKDRYSGAFRPVEARFGPDGRLYVVDFGQWVEHGPDPSGQTQEVTGPAANTGRILAFRLPGELSFNGAPVGNVGGRGDLAKNGTYGAAAENATVITAVEFGFSGDRSVTVGTPVSFFNRGVIGHTATEVNGIFNTGFDFAHNTTFTWVPTEPGTYAFYCELHPVMKGNVTVVAANSTA